MAKRIVELHTCSELVNVLTTAKEQEKRGGEFTAVYGVSDYRMNKFPTDGSEKIRISDDFSAKNNFHVVFHFSQDYEKTMAKVLGLESYDAHDSNRVHIIPNVLMQYVSTGNICLIYMPENYVYDGLTVNGHTATEEEKAYAERYKAKRSASTLPYRTLGVKNITKVVIGQTEYICKITDLTLQPTESESMALAMAL